MSYTLWPLSMSYDIQTFIFEIIAVTREYWVCRYLRWSFCFVLFRCFLFWFGFLGGLFVTMMIVMMQTGSLHLVQLSWNSLHTPGWPWVCSRPPTSASWARGLWESATVPSLVSTAGFVGLCRASWLPADRSHSRAPRALSSLGFPFHPASPAPLSNSTHFHHTQERKPSCPVNPSSRQLSVYFLVTILPILNKSD